MTTDELRDKLMSRIDSLLARTFLVYGQDRQLLSALRGYVAGMAEDELKKILVHIPKRDERPVATEANLDADLDKIEKLMAVLRDTP